MTPYGLGETVLTECSEYSKRTQRMDRSTAIFVESTTTLLDEVLPEFDVEVFSGWLRRDFLRKIARNSTGSA